jgi:hypothetical protein
VPLALAGGSALSLLAIAVVWWRRPAARALAEPGDEDRHRLADPARRREQGMAEASCGASSRSLAAR